MSTLVVADMYLQRAAYLDHRNIHIVDCSYVPGMWSCDVFLNGPDRLRYECGAAYLRLMSSSVAFNLDQWEHTAASMAETIITI